MNGYRFEFDCFVPYREVGPAYRPLLTARFEHGELQTDLTMLLDSGADNLVLPDRIREFLGILTGECEPVQAATMHGLQLGFLGPPLQVRLPDLSPDALFSGRPVFSPWLNDRTYGLLGREPALDYLRVCFSHSDGFGFYLSLRHLTRNLPVVEGV